MIKAILKTSFEPLKMKEGEKIEVKPIGTRSVKSCVYYGQKIYRPTNSNHWIPEEDLIFDEKQKI